MCCWRRYWAQRAAIVDNVLLVLYVFLVIGTVLLFRRMKKRQQKKNGLFRYAAAVMQGIWVGLLFCGGAFVLFNAMMTEANYYIFTESRKETIAERTGITEGEGVDFTHFLHAFGGPDGSLIRLELECDTDGMTFLEDCCDGTLSVYTVDGVVYDVDEQNGNDVMRGTVQQCTNDPECVGFYQYYLGNRGYNVWFYAEEDHYRVLILS